MYTGFPVIFLGLLYWVILTFFQRKDKIFIKIFGSLAGTCEAYRAYIKPAVKKKVKIWERFPVTATLYTFHQRECQAEIFHNVKKGALQCST